MAVLIYGLCGYYVWHFQDYHHIAQRSFRLTLFYLLANLMVILILISEFILLKTLKSEYETLRNVLEIAYGVAKFTMLAAYVLRCLRLVIVFSKAAADNPVNRFFKNEYLLILSSLTFAIGLGTIAVATSQNFVFANYLMLKKCVCLDSFLLLAVLLYGLFLICLAYSLKV